MRAVGIRELKNRLSEYVRVVRSGEEILITDRGEVVAELRPPEPTRREPEPYPGLADLARRGALTLGGPNAEELYPAFSRVVPVGESRRLLDEERDER
jgi:prevent-host-death family protein